MVGTVGQCNISDTAAQSPSGLSGHAYRHADMGSVEREKQGKTGLLYSCAASHLKSISVKTQGRLMLSIACVGEFSTCVHLLFCLLSSDLEAELLDRVTCVSFSHQCEENAPRVASLD
jgi:hypothetical protein